MLLEMLTEAGQWVEGATEGGTEQVTAVVTALKAGLAARGE
jgi:hypothetical protein